ncbi:MAG: FAD-binding protein, partial [Chloroflexi bacterium]|nr:FAD-binding protein [Chloroflexota bacterium]
MADKVVTTDVLVLGGGLAGCMAAIRAREQGARVTVVDKAAIQRSGDAGRGFFFYNSYFNSGDPTDTAEAYRKWWGDVRYGLVDMKVVDALVINPQPLVQQYLEKMGVPLKDAVTGRVRKDPRMYDQGDDVVRGNIEFHRVFFQGENIKTILGKRVEELGAQVIERVQVTR